MEVEMEGEAGRNGRGTWCVPPLNRSRSGLIFSLSAFDGNKLRCRCIIESAASVCLTRTQINRNADPRSPRQGDGSNERGKEQFLPILDAEEKRNAMI